MPLPVRQSGAHTGKGQGETINDQPRQAPNNCGGSRLRRLLQWRKPQQFPLALIRQQVNGAIRSLGDIAHALTQCLIQQPLLMHHLVVIEFESDQLVELQ